LQENEKKIIQTTEDLKKANEDLEKKNKEL